MRQASSGTEAWRLRDQSDRLDAERPDRERDFAVRRDRQRRAVFFQQARLDRFCRRAEERRLEGGRCRFALRLDEPEHDPVAVRFGGLDRGANDVRLIDGKETRSRLGQRARLLADDNLGHQRIHGFPAELVRPALLPIARMAPQRPGEPRRPGLAERNVRVEHVVHQVEIHAAVGRRSHVHLVTMDASPAFRRQMGFGQDRGRPYSTNELSGAETVTP